MSQACTHLESVVVLEPPEPPLGCEEYLKAGDRVDDFGRLLRYVVRSTDAVNVNVRLVAVGAAAPYFFEGARGRYANSLETLAKKARAKRIGLWGACPRTVYDPYRGIETRR